MNTLNIVPDQIYSIKILSTQSGCGFSTNRESTFDEYGDFILKMIPIFDGFKRFDSSWCDNEFTEPLLGDETPEELAKIFSSTGDYGSLSPYDLYLAYVEKDVIDTLCNVLYSELPLTINSISFSPKINWKKLY